MKINVTNLKSLETTGTKVWLTVSISNNEEPTLTLTKWEFDRLGIKVIAKIKAVEAKGFYVLKVARILKGLTQSDMAKILGISTKTYQRRETKYDNADFTLYDIISIRREFNISADTLFFTHQYLKLA